ncbi:MAG: Flp pilus assembly complex ATPase component TadA [Bacilli bacterium]|nr:Flp pilus assembly complex ATPase component TadA [Bacilli bacterium]MBR6137756.1 Flp pilus assembly complex ATPase component TadA [Bacilli bacterium]
MMVQFDVKRVQKGTESFMVSFDFTKTPVTQIADYVIIAAAKYGASDIHFDPRGEGMMIRFRIDGDCQDYTFVPKAYEKNLTTRLKIMANMNITESRLPQDGAIKGNFGDQYLDMRVSSLPLNEGEKVVIRILDYSRSLDGLDTLGFHPNNLEKVKRMMTLPNGIILTTGATGSGKSTTTYSILQGLNKPETNIITVEDPIEMNIEGINQVQVNSDIGMTFAAALRSILRQDPNVILIGEIRDSETAQIAVRASITGHLVLSTIHTNNALATIERLLDMDVERYLLSTALSGIISQRLAKMLCPDCRYQRETTKYEKKVFKKFMNMDVTHVWDANPNGCEHCRRGYHGRLAFHEVLELDDDIRAALNNEKLEKKDLAKMVYTGKTITMLQDALIKCLEGLTSFEEVYRTIEIENEDDDNYENEIATEIKESIPVVEEEEEDPNSLSEDPVASSNTLEEEGTIVLPDDFVAQTDSTDATASVDTTTSTEASTDTTITPAYTPSTDTTTTPEYTTSTDTTTTPEYTASTDASISTDYATTPQITDVVQQAQDASAFTNTYVVPGAGSLDTVSPVAQQNAYETGSVAVPETVPPVTQNTYIDQTQMVNYVTPQVMTTPYVPTTDMSTVPQVEATIPPVEATIPTLDSSIPVVDPSLIDAAVQNVVLQTPIAEASTENAQPVQQEQVTYNTQTM